MKIRNMKQVKQVTAHMKDVKMKRLFRRNRIIITTLAVMIAAAGYLNYAGKRDLAAAGNIYEAGMMDISDEDLLAENNGRRWMTFWRSEVWTGPGIRWRSTPREGLAQKEEVGAEAAERLRPRPEERHGSGDRAAGSGRERRTGCCFRSRRCTGCPAGIENPGEAVLTSGMSVADYIGRSSVRREQVRARNKETLMSLINSTSIDEAAKQQAIQDMIRLTEISEKENAAETLLMAKGFSDPVVSVADEKVDVVINAPSITDPQRAQIEDIVKRKTEVGSRPDHYYAFEYGGVGEKEVDSSMIK